jgi:hypothetical protein
MRKVDRERGQSQVEFLQRITRGGEVDLEQVLKERQRLADKVDALRGDFIKYLKAQGYSHDEITHELQESDRFIREMRRSPFEMPKFGF